MVLEALAVAAVVVVVAAVVARLIERRPSRMGGGAPPVSGPGGSDHDAGGEGQPAPGRAESDEHGPGGPEAEGSAAGSSPSAGRSVVPPPAVADGARAAAELRPVEAVACWRDALDTVTTGVRAPWVDRARWELAGALRELGRFGEAEAELSRIPASSAEVGPGDVTAALGTLAGMMGRLEVAERQLRAAEHQVRLATDDAWLALEQGIVARDRGDPAEALRLLRSARDQARRQAGVDHGTEELATVLLVQAAVRAGDPGEAAVHLTGARRAATRFARAYLDVAEAELDLATGSAVEAAERAAAARSRFGAAGLRPYEAEATWVLGRALVAAGRPDGARTALAQAAEAYEQLGCRAQPPQVRAELERLA